MAKELHQLRSKHLQIYVMCLAFQRALLPVRDGLCQCGGRIEHERYGAAVHDQGRCGQPGSPFDRYRAVLAHAGRIVSQDRRHSFEHRPRRGLLHPFNLVGGSAHELHEQHHCFAPAAGGQEFVQLFPVIPPGLAGAVAGIVRRLIQRQLFHLFAECDCRFERQARA